MIKQVFVIYDSKACYYKQPFMFLAKGEAIRAFSDAANDPKCEFGLHPEDFTLFHIATFDELKAKYEMLPAPVSLGCAIEYKKNLEV